MYVNLIVNPSLRAQKAPACLSLCAWGPFALPPTGAPPLPECLLYESGPQPSAR